MKIGEFSTCTGLSKDTIRYYEKIDLLHPELKNNLREYTEEDIQIVEAIIKLKQTGFLLREIKMLFDWSKNTEQNKKLSKDEISNLLLIKDVFQNKYKEMVHKQAQIIEIKQILLRADDKIVQLLEENKG